MNKRPEQVFKRLIKMKVNKTVPFAQFEAHSDKARDVWMAICKSNKLEAFEAFCEDYFAGDVIDECMLNSFLENESVMIFERLFK